MFRQLQGRWHKRSQRQRFQRHCRHIFPFEEHLTAAERGFVERACFGQTPAQDGDALPWRAVFAHRVSADAVDSSYFAPRLCVPPALAWDEALATMPLLRRTYLIATMDALSQAGVSWRFDGLGWRFHAGHFWVHCIVDDVERLPGRPWAALRQALAEHRCAVPYEARGVISLRLHEHRIVGHELLVTPRAPELSAHCAQEPQSLHALKVSSQDGMIEEVLRGGAFPRLDLRLNHLGRHLLKRYQRWGEEPAAFVFHRADVCTLFFA